MLPHYQSQMLLQQWQAFQLEIAELRAVLSRKQCELAAARNDSARLSDLVIQACHREATLKAQLDDTTKEKALGDAQIEALHHRVNELVSILAQKDHEISLWQNRRGIKLLNKMSAIKQKIAGKKE